MDPRMLSLTRNATEIIGGGWESTPAWWKGGEFSPVRVSLYTFPHCNVLYVCPLGRKYW